MTCEDCGGDVSTSNSKRCRPCYDRRRASPPLLRAVCADCGQRFLIAETARTRRNVCTKCSAERQRKRQREYIQEQLERDPQGFRQRRRKATGRYRAKRGKILQQRTPEQRKQYAVSTRQWRYSEGRTCRDCGSPIYNGNQTGRCRACKLNHMNSQPRKSHPFRRVRRNP